MVRLTGRPDMTLDVYRGRKQQHNNNNADSHELQAIISLIGTARSDQTVQTQIKLFLWEQSEPAYIVCQA